MSENHEILRIFVASPSGLDQERKAIGSVVEEINRRNSSNWQLQFKAIGWEDTVGGNRRAQDIINRDLETCDYFFGIIADHWGSPPQAEGEFETGYTSGFHEEFELAQGLFETGKMKDILLFFKEIPDDRMRDIGPSLQKVLDFRKKVRDERQPLYTEFENLEVFKAKIGDALSKIGWETTTPRVANNVAAPSDRNTSDMVSESDREGAAKEYFLSQPTRTFFNDINNKRDDYEAVTNTDVARLRLISDGVGRVGNDDGHIGVHDANLLFRARATLELSDMEKATLLMAGLRHMETHNVPFWYWTGGDVGRLERVIRFRMMNRDENVSSSALTLATILGYSYSIPDLENKFGRGLWIKRWFEDGQTSKLHNAAQRYLSTWADEADVPVLQEVRDKMSGQQAANLDCIVIGMRFRRSEADGLKELTRRNPEHVSAELQEILRDKFQGFSSEVLEGLAGLKAEYLRLASVRELICRNAFSGRLAEELSADNSIEVRLEAIKALADKDVPIAEDRARDALVITAANRGLRGLLGVGSGTNDTSRFDNYQRHLLRHKTLDELFTIEKKSDPFDADALLAAFQIFPKQTDILLRSLLKEGFDKRYESHLSRIMGFSGAEAKELGRRASDLKDFCCLEQIRDALNILAAQLKREDLALVREVMDRWEIEASEEVLVYLSRFGDWEDIQRILKLDAKHDGGVTLLTANSGTNQELMGVTLVKVGANRLVDLLEEIDAPTIKASVIKVSTQKVFAGLSNDKMLELMNEEAEGLRTVTALRCVDSLSKTRIAGLLDRYMEGDEYRYYNVIHWLDLGVTMPRTLAQKVVREKLKTI